ncbi:NAD(P)-dependent oxidoreductase [Parafrankia sp. EUN1f]|uniref:NAD(P)-dependent oxidoreductase n=1 Tax=Parafrankia sp. EUN1f TaxID=102897 RepID=UPI0001C45AC6|nr:NAD(P)-dependent oxidoreductase [Parafrankia sp. EUN1f]EFC81969.1 6-phosphogluconate dehydrogenase NAD-binding [Parafrankia sp. EUN1f]
MSGAHGDGGVRVGFVGLGSQGAPMARRILDAGFPTTLWARRPEAQQPFADTAARFAASRVELGAASDLLGVCVVGDADADEVLRGPDGALAGMAPGGIVVVHSTTRPDTCRRLQEDHPHLHVLDAPVSGGGAAAAERRLLVMVGGEAGILERCRPVLTAFADPIVHLGPLGSGQEAKVFNNALFTAQLALAAEVHAAAQRRGLDPAAMATVLRGGSGHSFAAEVVARNGFHLAPLAGSAGPLLAKDVGILAGLLAPVASPLIDMADAALTAMGLARTAREDHS